MKGSEEIVKFENLIVCICKCILFEASHIFIKCNNENEANQEYNRLIKAIKENLTADYDSKDLKITLGNTSSIQFVFPRKESEFIRGQRAKIIDWSDCSIDIKMLDEVLNDYISQDGVINDLQ